MRMISRGLVAASLLLAAGAANAQEMDHSKMAPSKTQNAASASAASSTEAYKQADMTMHGAMQRDYTGDADVDFLKGMVPHHQGAIDMARVVLKYGKDPQVKRLAEEIVSAQEKEIAEMKALIAKLSKPAN